MAHRSTKREQDDDDSTSENGTDGGLTLSEIVCIFMVRMARGECFCWLFWLPDGSRDKKSCSQTPGSRARDAIKTAAILLYKGAFAVLHKIKNQVIKIFTKQSLQDTLFCVN